METLLGFYYIFPYYERTADIHKGEREREEREGERMKQERRIVWGYQFKTKDTKEWTFLSSENAASKERRLHSIPRLWSAEVRPKTYLAITAARKGDFRREGGNWGGPEVKNEDSQMLSPP